MVSTGFPPHHQESSIAFKRRYDHSLPTYRQRKLAKVTCELCGQHLNDQYLPLHHHEQHHIIDSPSHPDTPDIEPITYEVSFPQDVFRVPCPVSGCPAMPTSRSNMRSHFNCRHDPHHILILEEGLLPQCPNCGFHLHSVNDAHRASRTCRQGTQRRLQRKRMADQAFCNQVTFSTDGHPFENVEQFRYLGRILHCSDLDSQAVSANLKTTRERWGRISRLLSADGANPRTMARFYLAVVQSVLLHGASTWTLSKRDLGRLERFHAKCARRMAHQPIRRLPTGEWITPHTSDVLDICGLSPISAYITKRKTRLLHYAKDHSPVYQACLRCVPIASPARHILWWT